MRIYFIILALVYNHMVFGQSFNVNLSGKHLKKVERAKTARSKLEKYRKLYTKDSLKALKKEKKYWRNKSDSLKNALVGDTDIPDTSSLPLDSAAVDSLNAITLAKAEEALRNNGAFNEYSSEFEEGKKYTDALGDKEKAKELVSEKSKEYESELTQQEQFQELADGQQQWQSLNDEVEGHKKNAEGLHNKVKDRDTLKKKAEEMSHEQAEDFLANNAEIVKTIQNEMSLLQNKYSKVVRSDDLTSAVKKKSLRGAPLKERLFIGGNFNITSTDPFSLDLTPQLGYKFNKKFIVGAGFVYRNTFSSDSIDMAGVPEDATGYNIFSSYHIAKGFFTYAEFNQISTSKNENDKSSTLSVTGMLAGVGRRFSVHKMVTMNVMVLYNFMHNPGENTLTPSPWSVKFGFNVSELGLLKK